MRRVAFGFVLVALGGCGTSAEETVGATSQAVTAPAWQAGVAYSAGASVSHGGRIYRVIQGYTSQAGWKPSGVPALYADEGADTGGAGGSSSGGSGSGGSGGRLREVTLDSLTLGVDCNADPERCCLEGSDLVTLTPSDDTFTSTTVNQCIVSLTGRDTVALHSIGRASLFLGDGDDTAMDGDGDTVILGGPGSDTIHGYGGTNFFFGNAGNDVLLASQGTNHILPGPGKDTASSGSGNDSLYIFDLCEVASGETLDGGSGADTLITPVPLNELVALGVTVSNFENVIVEASSCRSECSVKPDCSGHGSCAEGAAPGVMKCACDSGWVGVNCSRQAGEPRPLPRPSAPPVPEPRRFAVNAHNLVGAGTFLVPTAPGVPVTQLGPDVDPVLPTQRPSQIPPGFQRRTDARVEVPLEFHLRVAPAGDGLGEKVVAGVASRLGDQSNAGQVVIEEGDDCSVFDCERPQPVEYVRSVTLKNDGVRDGAAYVKDSAGGVYVATAYPVDFLFFERNAVSSAEGITGRFFLDTTARTYGANIDAGRFSSTPFSASNLVRETGQIWGSDTPWVPGRMLTDLAGNEVTWWFTGGAPVIPATSTTKVCPHWTGYFVDEEVPGTSWIEGVRGRALGELRARAYPAAHAHYEVVARGAFATLNSQGQLDGEGCFDMPTEVLVHEAAATAGAVSGGLAFWLRISGAIGEFRVRDDATDDFVEASFGLNSFGNGPQAWTNQDGYLWPPARFELAGEARNHGTTVAAAISSNAGTLRREGLVVAGPLDVWIGRGQALDTRDHRCRAVVDSVYDSIKHELNVGPGFFPPSSALACSACERDAECPSNECDLGRCALAVSAPEQRRACSTSEDCPGGQHCSRSADVEDGCNGASDCFCAYAGQGTMKYVTSHELGHMIQKIFTGETPGAGYGFKCPSGNCEAYGRVDHTYLNGDLLDPPGVAEVCGCQHVTSANGAHCLQSIERFPDAEGEGFAQYFSSKMWNVDGGECVFNYYKDFLDTGPGATCRVSGDPEACSPYSLRNGGTGVVTAPPVAVRCDVPAKWRNRSECTLPAIGNPANPEDLRRETMSTEYDWMTFLYALDEAGYSMGDIFSLYNYACHPGYDPTNDLPFKCSEEDPNGNVGLPIEWLDRESSPGTFEAGGFLDGARRKWGVNDMRTQTVEQRGRDHGVDNNTQ